MFATDPIDRFISAWFSNNVEGSYKRSVVLAMIISVYVPLAVTSLFYISTFSLFSGNINGAVSSNVVSGGNN